ncbi:MAG: single-strand DNA-binding protein [Mycobacteriales bacterium]
MYETTVTVIGNLVEDPRMRTTESGIEVTNFRIASTARRFDREAGSWVDGGSVYLGVACWRALGINVVTSLHKGDPVVVHGRLFTRQYERDGQTRSAYELEALTVGPDLARGTATFKRIARSAVPATYSATDEHGVPEMPDVPADGYPPRLAETVPSPSVDVPPDEPAGQPVGVDDPALDRVRPAGGLVAVAG